MRIKLLRSFLLLMIGGLGGSCTALNGFLATPVPVVRTQTPLPSATFDWFPASLTPTSQVYATRAATPEMRPGLSDVFLTDKLVDPALWDTAASDEASAEIDGSQLNLAVQSGVYMVSLRHDLIVDDFYAEITARTGLCRAGDTYGFLVRANAVAYYRFSLSCNGMVSVERVSGPKRQVLQPPLPSGDVPPGAPGEVRIGVWAVGTEMRLFLNGHYQCSVSDSNYASGTLGVFVHSVGNTAAAASFSDLSVQAVTYRPPTRTPQP